MLPCKFYAKMINIPKNTIFRVNFTQSIVKLTEFLIGQVKVSFLYFGNVEIQEGDFSCRP